MPGWTHDSRRHALSVASSLHVILYMFAVGPRRSGDSTPEKPSIRDSARTPREARSLRTGSE